MGTDSTTEKKQGKSCPILPIFKAIRSKSFWLALLIPLLALAALLLLPKSTIRLADIHVGYWILIANLALIVLLKIALVPQLLAWWKSNRPPLIEFLLVGAITAGSLILAVGSVEGRHRVQSDESIFLASAQNMYHHHRSATCDEGIFSVEGDLDCFVDSPSFKARGQSAIWSVLMPVLGKDLHWIFTTRAILLGLTLPFLFLALRFWTRNAFLSLVATALFGYAPMTLFQFRSTSVEPLYVFFLVGALLILHFVLSPQVEKREGDQPWRDILPWLLFGAVLGFFAQTRQETVFALFAFVLAALPTAIRHPKRWWALISSLTLFSLPVLFTIAHYRGYNFQGGEFGAHGHFFSNIASNWKVMTTDMVGSKLANPFLTSHTWLALLGLITMIGMAWKRTEYRKWGFFLLLYALQAYMILENVSGDFTIEINQRYALILMPVMAFFGALFLDELLRRFLPAALGSRPITKTGGAALALALVAAVLIGSLALRQRESLEANAMYSRNHLTTEEYEIHDWIKNNPLPAEERALFVYNRPWHFIGYGLSSVNYTTWNRWNDQERQQKMEEFGGKVYYVRGLYCWEQKTYHVKAVETRNAAICDQFENNYPLQTLFEKRITNNYPLVVSQILDGKQGASLAGAFASRQISQLELQTEGDSLLLSAQIAPIAEGHRFALEANNSDPIELAIPTEGMAVRIMLPKRSGLNRVLPQLVSPNGESTPLTPLKLFVEEGAQLLTQFEPITAVQSWGTLQKNRTVNGNPLTVRREQFAAGLGTHAASQIDYEIGKNWKWFEGAVGFDDEELGGDGMLFSIQGDGRELFRSATITPNDLQWFRVDISGVQKLTLVVDSLSNKDYDHANWLYPTLLSR